MKSRWMAPAGIATMWIFALAVFPRLPARVPTHWNAYGQVDGWMSRSAGAFLFPAIASALVALLLAIPRIDPRGRHVAIFRGEWRLFINLLVGFMAVLQVAAAGVALGWPVDMGRVTIASVGVLFIGMGNYMPRIRSNWFMGIRTPWTMESESVWRATHRVAGRSFVAGGVLTVLSIFLPSAWQVAVTVAVALGAAFYPAVYSYFAWKREKAGESL